jgi:hypothetical protein
MRKNNSALAKAILPALTKVFARPPYVLQAGLVAYCFLVFVSILPNLQLLGYMFKSGAFGLGESFGFIFSLRGIATSATVTHIILLVVVAVLVGVNIALLVFLLRKRFALIKKSSTSIAGIIIALLGVGCASCGSVLLTSFIGLGASTAIVGFLPFNGMEFNFLSIILLLISIHLVSKKIGEPIVC